MGIGDEIIATGHARTAFGKNGKPVLICDIHGKGRWSLMWQGIPWIVHPHHKPEDFQRLPNGPRCRPYIDYRKGFSRRGGMNFTKWRVRDNVGFIQLTEAEMRWAVEAAKQVGGPFVVLEPQIRDYSNPNKQWGQSKWYALAALLRQEGLIPVQMGVGGFRLKNVRHVHTPDIRRACAFMKFARWAFLPDGGLHHAAAVLGVPATVLWGGANDPEILGYPTHENIYFPAMCGKWVPCRHCSAIWNWLSPEYVLAKTKENPLWQKLSKS